jgi:hypothetical protein
VTDRTERQRLAAENTRLRLALVREGRLLFIGAVAVLLIAGGIGTFILFRHLAYADLVAARQQIDQLQTERQELEKTLNRQISELATTTSKLHQATADLEAIRPAKDTYAVPPNESRFVADGRLAIGMIGAPANESVTLSINGKQQTLIAGQTINVALDPSTNCRVVVQSFDMFKALVNATCTPAKR